MIKPILFLLISVFLSAEALADADFQLVYQAPSPWSFSVFAEKDVFVSSESKQKSIETLMLLRAHPLFMKRLPARFSVLISSRWKGAQGYWNHNLKDYDGNPAILIRADALESSEDLARLLVHELAHYIHFQANPQDPTWQQEGFALLMEHIVTGTLNPVFRSGFSTPETSLTEVVNPHLDSDSIQVTSLRAAQYGHILQYFYYLYRNCGFLDFALEFLAPISTKNTKQDSLNRFFEKNKTSEEQICKSLNESFFAFSVARFSQNLVNPKQYVHFSSMRARVNESRSFAPKKIPPHSSSAYFKRSGVSCGLGDFELNSKTCLILNIPVK